MILPERLTAKESGHERCEYVSTDCLWDGVRLALEMYHDRSGEEALTYLYESGSYVPLARIDQNAPAANDADARDTVNYLVQRGIPGNAVQEEWGALASQRATPSWGEVSVVREYGFPVGRHAARAGDVSRSSG